MNKTISIAGIAILTLSLALSGIVVQDAMAVEPNDATIDIRPGTDSNYIFTSSRGLVPVVLFDEELYDFSLVDAESLQFGPANVSPVFQFSVDVNGDGNKDLLSFFKQNETGIECGDTAATLSFNVDDAPYLGIDNVTVAPC